MPGTVSGCHPSDYHRHEMTHGDHGTTADPKQDRIPLVLHDPGDVFLGFLPVANGYWAPWTIQDLTTNVSRPPAPGAFYFGTCVSCHDPHGTNPSYVTDQGEAPGDAVPNHMLRHNWKEAALNYFCTSMCHTPP